MDDDATGRGRDTHVERVPLSLHHHCTVTAPSLRHHFRRFEVSELAVGDDAEALKGTAAHVYSHQDKVCVHMCCCAIN